MCARRHSPTGLLSTTSCGLPRPADAQRVSLHGAVEGGRVSGLVLEAWASCCPSPRCLKVDYCRWSRHTTAASTASVSTKTLRCWPPAARYNAGHCPHTMRNRVYASVGRLSVCPSVRQQTLLLWPGRKEIWIDCYTAHSSAECRGRMWVTG